MAGGRVGGRARDRMTDTRLPGKAFPDEWPFLIAILSLSGPVGIAELVLVGYRGHRGLLS